jgi:hypothetical protein
VKTLVFNGCALPFRDKSFDVVYSNAVIEHLADRYAQQRFAAEVVRAGRGWFVTTPNLYYPVEPHYHLPLVQFLPQRWQRSLVKGLGRTPYRQLESADQTTASTPVTRGRRDWMSGHILSRDPDRLSPALAWNWN